ncbi:MAG TPA: TraR/DksA C4-type zinc finger protein [Bacillales bacterium]
MALTDQQWNELKEDLLDRRNRLEQQENHSSKPSLKNEPDELSVVDNHLADSASGIVNREKQMAEDSHKNRELAEVNEALERMDEGTYGICVDTGKEIPFERLKAIPYAKRTVTAEEEYAKERDQAAETMEGQSTSRLRDPDEEVEDSKARTAETIQEEHNSVEKPDQTSRLNQEPKQ